MGMRSNALKMSSMTPIPQSPIEVKAENGRVQISSSPDQPRIGLLVERGELFGGVLLSRHQAKKLANLLLKRLGLR